MTSSWKDAAELIGIAAILISLVFVGFQLKQAEEIAVAEMNLSLVSIGIESANLINSNVETWRKGNSEAELTADERIIFDNIVEAISTRYFVETRHAMRLGQTGQAEAMLHDWSGFLFDNPGAREVWFRQQTRTYDLRKTLNPSGESFRYFTEAVESDLRKLDGAATGK